MCDCDGKQKKSITSSVLTSTPAQKRCDNKSKSHTISLFVGIKFAYITSESQLVRSDDFVCIANYHSKAEIKACGFSLSYDNPFETRASCLVISLWNNEKKERTH